MIFGAKERILLLSILLSSIISLLYLLWGLLIYPRRADMESLKDYSGRSYIIKGIVMLLCPLAGPCFFFLGELVIFPMFRTSVDLGDVIFSKERVKSHIKADEEAARYIAPLEEAIAISDTASLRTLMMNIVKGDIRNSLAAISLALNSEDSETSHYAASVLRDELNDFRMNVQKLYSRVSLGDEDMEECGIMLIGYMNSVLEQKVFSKIEQNNLVYKMEEVCEILFQKNINNLDSQYLEWICMRLLEIKEYSLAEKWCKRSMVEYPDELSSYTCRLKLYYTMHEKEKFFQALEEVKKSSIIIDYETLELIRTFS